MQGLALAVYLCSGKPYLVMFKAAMQRALLSSYMADIRWPLDHNTVCAMQLTVMWCHWV